MGEAKRWRLSWGDKSWTEDDLTGAHLSMIVAGVGTDTWDIDPGAGPCRLMANLAAFLAADRGGYGKALVKVLAAPASVLLGALSYEDVPGDE